MKILLLLSTQPEDEKFGQETACATGMQLSVGKSEEEATVLLSQQDIGSVFCDTRFFKFLGSAPRNLPTDTSITCIASPEELNQKDLFEGLALPPNLILRRYKGEKEAAQHYARVVQYSQCSESTLKALGFPEGSIQTFQFESSIQKGFAASSVTDFLVEMECQPRMASLIANAVDELLMNAMFDAQVDKTGEQAHKHLRRSTELSATHVQLQLGVDGPYLAFMVSDACGTLNLSTAIKHVIQGFSTGHEVRRDEVSAGAGIGLALITRSGGSILFTTEPGVRTDVTVFFRKTDKIKDFKEQFQFVATRLIAPSAPVA